MHCDFLNVPPGTNKKIMNLTTRLLSGAASLAVAAFTTYTAQADNTNDLTFRTTGYFVGLAQGSNVITAKPIYNNVSFAGHALVNLAMGRSLTDTNYPKQVLAMTFECDLNSASLVVYDLASSNTLATIAASTAVDAIYQADPASALNQAGPNRARFAATLQIAANGNDTNGLAGGYFTVAGRINLNPKTGCPQPVLVVLDRDSLDKVTDDMELPASLDPDTVPLVTRTGLAHLIGVVDAVIAGDSHTILVPYGGLSIRRELSGAPAVSGPAAN